MRRYRAFAAWLRVAALVFVGAFAGCQSNSDRDLIARDRRMQENQVYALQDYVKQYQQLVCQYRAENASLRRQLADGTSAVETAPAERSSVPPSRSNAPAKSAPEFQTPIPPGAKEPQSPPPSAAPPATPPETTPKNDSLLVPPLKSTRGGRSPGYGDQSSIRGSSAKSSSGLLLASYDHPTEANPTGEAASAAGAPGTEAQMTSGDSTKPRSARSKSAALISGEIVANDSGGGPRLMVDVVPPAKTGGAELFEGKVSLMLLANGSNGQKRNLGRWDFSRDDVHAARHKGENEQALRFFIELPADTSGNEATQLWARIMPLEGGKSLVHAAIDLSQPGSFSSAVVNRPVEIAQTTTSLRTAAPNDATVGIVPSTDHTVATVSYEITSPPETVDSVATALNESSWSIAQPGKPANLPAEAADATGHGGWRLSNEPMPSVIQASAVQDDSSEKNSPNSQLPTLKPLAASVGPQKTVSGRAKLLLSQNPGESFDDRGLAGASPSLLGQALGSNDELPVAAAQVPGTRPCWSSQRSGAVSERTAARPSWSSKR